MKSFLVFVVAAAALFQGMPVPAQSLVPSAPPPSRAPADAKTAAKTEPAKNGRNDDENARQARALLEQAILALGGDAYLNIRDIEQEGRSYSFYHGRPTSTGTLFWRYVEFPDKERIDLTKEKDVSAVYFGNKGYEITYKGAHEIEKKDLEDYIRRRKFSLETMLRNWINDPSVALFYEGTALAGNLAAQQITLINAKDEAVSIFLDVDTHLPLKKTYSWRDPVDKERNSEEEIYDNYRPVQGVMTPWGFTRYFNGDMQSQRFLSGVKYNQGVDEAMFDPNSGYNPIKAEGKHQK
ncbi:MAG: hypothetical protein ACLQLC_16810 [Candidatus Sulfotelmatobacter sp.]